MRILKWVGIVVLLLVLAVVALPFFINVDQFRPTLQTELSQALGRQVTLGNLKLSILKGEVSADDLSVAEDPAFGKPVFIKAKSLHVGVEIWPFLSSRKLVVTDLTIDQPEINLVQAPSGNFNFSTMGAKGSTTPGASSPSQPLDLSVKEIKITNGHISLRRTVGHWKPLALEGVNVEVHDFSAASAFPFSLSAKVQGGGTLDLNGKAGPINAADSSMTPVNVTLKVAQLDLARSGMNDFAPEIAGLMSFDGSGDSNGTVMDLKGKLKIEKVKLAKGGTPGTRPLELDFGVAHDLRKHTGSLRQGDIHIGSAVAHLTGTYAEQGEEMVVHMKLAGPGMPVGELESMLGPLGIMLPAGSSLQGGTATAELTMEGPANKLVTAGTLSLNNTKLAGFNLPQKMSSIEKLAGIKEGPDTEIQVLSANVRSAPEGTDAKDLKLVLPSIGDLGGAGTISASNELDFKMTATVHATGLLAVAGNTPIPFTVTGTTANPVFRPDMKALGKEEVKSMEGQAKKAAGGLIKGLLGGKK
jgi:AsmA protein